MSEKTGNSDNSDEQPSFEQQLTELQQIVEQLESGRLGLDAALEKYQRGIQVLSSCQRVLRDAERKIEVLSGMEEDGTPITVPLDQESLTLEEKGEARGQRRSAKGKQRAKPTAGDVDDHRTLF